MNSVIVSQVLLYFLELLFVPVITNETIHAIAASYIKDVDTLQFRAAFSHSFDSLILAGYEEREAEIEALNSTFRSLDPYSEVIIPSEFCRLTGQGDSMPGGVGLFLVKHDGGAIVLQVVQGSSAERAGIEIGDALIDIDGTSLDVCDLDEIRQLLVGTPGSMVSITIMREGAIAPMTYELRRECPVLKNSVSRYEKVGDNVGYIHILNFLPAADDEIEGIVDQLKLEGVRKVIIDLRHNNGGLLSQAIAATSLFLPKGKEIVEVSSIRRHKPRAFKSSESNTFLEEIPLVIIVGSSTLSGAELFAGSLQDWDRALVLGDTTAGMGVVQNLVGISFGYGIRFTTSICYLPSGRTFDKFFGEKKNKMFETRVKKRSVQSYCIVPDVITSDRQGQIVSGNLLEDSWITRALDILRKCETKNDVFEVIH